ncbi:peptidase M24, structural domain-containing protein [Vararia minispora EC-137]|uniref:Peptidase M24, structural domain-containing protein n=1 Tax=Vararia minispora EC-137 TaxID=1314806 RepID=A0ACB8QUN3_9AGAM|nr:peptidase M24, structural domain-containing protein [Vararia minispora EC-137]
MAPPPPPPPPPLCLPSLGRSRRNRQLDNFADNEKPASGHRTRSRSVSVSYASAVTRSSASSQPLVAPPTLSAASRTRRDSLPAYRVSHTKLTEDSESYRDLGDDAPRPALATLDRSRTKLTRAKTVRERFGYGWGLGLRRDKAAEAYRELPRSHSPEPLPASTQTKSSGLSGATKASAASRRSARPSLSPTVDSSQTLVGSALQRKIDYEDPVREEFDTADRLVKIRDLMAKDKLDYYIIPSEDAHQSEYVAQADKRREWISGFTGSAGQAIISHENAYLVTDSRYWIQAKKELGPGWSLIPAGAPNGPLNFIDFLADRAKNARVGIDARMISYEHATSLSTALQRSSSKLTFPPQNFVDLARSERPARGARPVRVHGIEYTGLDAGKKMAAVREWIGRQPPATGPFRKGPPKGSDVHVGTIVSSLSAIAWVLNLRGDDVPFNPVFHAYLYIGLDTATLFVDTKKVREREAVYLDGLGVRVREYNDVWHFLRVREWGDGKILISNETTYAIALMLTTFRYTVAQPIIDEMKGVKNEVEIQGLKRAYTRDGACFVQFLAWLEETMAKGVQVSEWEAAWRLTEFRRKAKNFMGLAYENISAWGPNAALPHYSPRKRDCLLIGADAPYLNDSGGQYLDGTCDTTRTIHLGRPTDEQSEAFTRVLQGHIAIDRAVFPERTTGRQLDVLARRALWMDGLNYLHGTGHGVGSYLSVHEGVHSFANEVPLVPGHVITNEPGFYKAGDFGVRIESALVVRRVKTKHEYNGPVWLGFERLACVPIQTKMVVESLLSREEKEWLRDHNRECVERLEPLLRDDKRAIKWLRRQAEAPLGVQPVGPAGLLIDWGA